MHSNILVYAILFRSVASLSLPILPSFKDCQQQVLASIAGIVLATTSLPISANAVEVIKIDADIPGLIQIAKDNKDVALKLAREVSGVVKISDYPKAYSNLLNFARDAAAGDVYVQINGIPIDVSVLSEKGAIDIDLSTEIGDIGVTIASERIPKLPFLSKRVVPISTTTTKTTGVDGDVIESTKSSRTKAGAAIENAKKDGNKSFFDQPFIIDLFQQGWTNQQVFGTTSLGLGIAYGSSYAYYVKSQEDEEKATAEKKKKATAKTAVVKVETAKVPPVVSKPQTTETNIEAKTDTPEVKKDTETVKPKKSIATKPIPGEVGLVDVIKSLEQTNQNTKRKRGLRFWKNE